jgi:hypothetical protein
LTDCLVAQFRRERVHRLRPHPAGLRVRGTKSTAVPAYDAFEARKQNRQATGRLDGALLG